MFFRSFLVEFKILIKGKLIWWIMVVCLIVPALSLLMSIVEYILSPASRSTIDFLSYIEGVRSFGFFVCPVIFIWFFSSAANQENKWGVLRTLVGKGIPRSILVISKYLVSVLFAAMILYATCCAIPVMASPFFFLTGKLSWIELGNAILPIFNDVPVFLLSNLTYFSFAFLIVTLTDSSGIGIGSIAFLYILEFFLLLFSSKKHGFFNFLPYGIKSHFSVIFHSRFIGMPPWYQNSWDPAFAYIGLFIYLAILLGLSILAVHRKDLVETNR